MTSTPLPPPQSLIVDDDPASIRALSRILAGIGRLACATTGAANRCRFDELLDGEFRRTQRHGRRLALLPIDLDVFERCNDLEGHPAGDAPAPLAAVLSRCRAARLQRCRTECA